MKRILTLLTIAFSFLAMNGMSQTNWFYDFGSANLSYSTSNGSTTTFFPSTPNNGGTYRVKISNGKGGKVDLVYPSPYSTTGAHAKLTASSTTSTTKWGVYDWLAAKDVLHIKFGLSTSSSTDGSLSFSLGNSTSVTDNNNYSNQYANSLSLIVITYSSGNLSKIERREGKSFSLISSSGITKNSHNEIEIFANNSNAPKSYSIGGVSYTLLSQTWDLWIDNVKLSPANGYAKSESSSSSLAIGNLTGFAFYGESSTSNSAQLVVDDLYYSTVLPSGPSLPTVSTTTASNITANSFDAGGNVTADGGATVTKKGLTWDLVSPATASSSINGTGTGSFTGTAASVNPNTKYYYRAYATNSAGTSYGSEYSVITLPEQVNQGTPNNATTNGFTANWSAPTVAGTETYTYTIEVDDDNNFGSIDYSKTAIASSSNSEMVSGLLPGTTYFYRVKAVNASGSGSWSATASITTLNASTPYLYTTDAPADFGTRCLNAVAVDSFILHGTNLTGSDVTINALAGFTYSLTKNGTYSSSQTLPSYNGAATVVYIHFIPTTVQTYDGNIGISGGGAATNVSVTGSGVNTPPSVTTNTPTGISVNEATIKGTIADEGCSSINSVGFEYGTTSGFANGSGTVATGTLSGSTFSATLTLNPNTTYYYKAFAENGGGKEYGAELSFTTSALQAPLATAASGIKFDEFTANWTAVAGAGSYAIDVMTDTGVVIHEGFDNAPTAPAGWSFNPGIGSYTTSGNYGNSSPSLKFGNNNDSIKSPVFNIPVDTLSFWCKSQSISGNTKLIILGFDGTSWISIDTMTTFPTTGTVIKYYNGSTPSLPSNLKQIKFIYLKDKGNLSFDDVTVSSNRRFLPGYKNMNVAGTSKLISGLSENTEYFYLVRAVATSDTSENSNIISVKTYNNPATADYVSVASGNFSNAANWEYNSTGNTYAPATQPPSNNNVLIKHNITFDQNFTLASGKSMIVTAGNTIKINSGVTLNLNNQNLLLKSNNDATAALGKIEGTLSNATNVTIERFIPAKRAWRHLSAPISHIGSPTIYQSWMEGGSNTGGLGTHITGTGTGIWDSATAPSIKVLNSPGTTWGPIYGTDDPISDYQSYMLFVRGDRTIPLSQGTAAAPNPTVLRITGTPLTGNQNKVAYYSYHFSDIGNPYPSAVDFQLLNRTNVKDLFYVWDAKRGSNGAWVTFTGPSYAPAEGTGGSYLNPSNSIIESGQAFIVVHDSLATTDGFVRFTENAKVDGVTPGNVYKTATVAGKINVQLNENNNGNLNLMDGASVWTDAGFENAVNGSDVTKLNNFGENIAFTRDGQYLVLEKRKPVSTDNDTLFIALWNTKEKNYQLSLNLNIDPVITATLEDLYTNTSTLLNNTGNSIYDFAIHNDAGSKNINRFIIVMKSNATLPCKIVSVAAAKKQEKVHVSFVVANELNIAKYDVERSYTGKDFEVIGNVSEIYNDQHQHQYNFVDAMPLTEVSYYRIAAIGKDGKKELSEIVRVNNDNRASQIAVYPNPVKGNMVNLQMTGIDKGAYIIKIYDVQGREVHSESINVSSENVNIKMIVPGMTSAGAYLMHVINNGNVVLKQSIISEK